MRPEISALIRDIYPDLEDQRRNSHAPDGGSDEDVDGETDDSDDDALGDEASSADTFEEQFRWLEEEVATLVADVHDLALYSKLNLTGFMKILKVRYVVLRSHLKYVHSWDFSETRRECIKSSFFMFTSFEVIIETSRSAFTRYLYPHLPR